MDVKYYPAAKQNDNKKSQNQARQDLQSCR